MINIYLCEDDQKQLQSLQQIINSIIVDHQLDMGISLASQDPHELFDKVRTNHPEKAIYVLDIQLHSDISGIQLATQNVNLCCIGKFQCAHTNDRWLLSL